MLALFFFTGERFIFTAVPLFLTDPEDNRERELHGLQGSAPRAGLGRLASDRSSSKLAPRSSACNARRRVDQL